MSEHFIRSKEAKKMILHIILCINLQSTKNHMQERNKIQNYISQIKQKIKIQGRSMVKKVVLQVCVGIEWNNSYNSLASPVTKLINENKKFYNIVHIQ